MNNSRPTSCFAGTRLEALLTLHRFTDVKSIVTLAGSRVHQHCKSNGIACDLVQKKSKHDAFATLARQATNLVLSAGFPLILPGDLLSSGPSFLNSHPSLLPNYRGFSPIKEAFGNREEYMGVTVHFMVEEVDAGPHIHQEKIRVEGLTLQATYDLLFGVVEPIAITKALERLLKENSK